MSEWNATEQTEGKWRDRVSEWRASGETAAAFASTRGFAASTLQYWSYRLSGGEKKGKSKSKKQRFVHVVPRSIAETTEREIIVEVGTARVRVSRGFDAELLAEVMRALGAVTR